MTHLTPAHSVQQTQQTLWSRTPRLIALGLLVVMCATVMCWNCIILFRLEDIVLPALQGQAQTRDAQSLFIGLRAITWFLLAVLAFRHVPVFTWRYWPLMPIVVGFLTFIIINAEQLSIGPNLQLVLCLITLVIAGPMTQLWLNFMAELTKRELICTLVLGYTLLLTLLQFLVTHQTIMLLLAPWLVIIICLGFGVLPTPDHHHSFSRPQIGVIMQITCVGLGAGCIAATHSLELLTESITTPMSAALFIMSGTIMLFIALSHCSSHGVSPVLTCGLALGTWNGVACLIHEFNLASHWILVLAFYFIAMGLAAPYFMNDLLPRYAKQHRAVQVDRVGVIETISTHDLAEIGAKYELTDRELEILAEFLHHQSISEIAQTLSIAPGTVKSHASHLYSKTSTANRRELIRLIQHELTNTTASV